jgi:Fur family ferric uptake transcriptional regulator
VVVVVVLVHCAPSYVAAAPFPGGWHDGGAVSEPTSDLLRASGFRATPQRQMVLQVLREARDRHLTADDVCRAVQDRYPSFNRSTTYRVLEMLGAIGLVQQTRLGDGIAHFEVVDHPDRHHHLVCVRCGKVQNVPADVLGEISVRLAERHSFHIGTVDLMIRGECASCRGRAG